MLQSLRIKNLALLDEVSLDFEPGFTAVTGETGAGKSVLLGALELLAGARADKTIIRQGAAACEVEAGLYFQDSRMLDAALEELNLPPCEDGMLVLKRSLPREKPPKITVNGGLATLAALQTLGEKWIDFHGSGEPRRLLKADCQRELLDLFARHGDEVAAYQERYRTWLNLLDQRKKLAGETQLSPDQVEFIQLQIARIDDLELSVESVEKLERDFQRSSQTQTLAALARQLADGIAGDEGLLGRLAPLVKDANQLGSLDTGSAPLAERIHSLAVELEDIGSEFGRLAQDFVFDPEQAGQLVARMNSWLELKRKHGGNVQAVLAAREEMARRLEAQGDLKGTLAKLDAEAVKVEKDLHNRASALRATREKAAQSLAKLSSKLIAQLGFKKAGFDVKITKLPELGPCGDSAVEFLFSPNVGEPPLPLGKIASSGELARVMLALKTVLADLDNIPLLVFDEVDANIGGEIGRVVGEKMGEIAQKHQVLCVTHLPQVASQAASHFVVNKDQTGGRAVVTISSIHGQRKARVTEIARMLGDRSAKSAIAHAEELLGR